MAPTPEQIQLIRDHEPALYFVGQPGQKGAERFFPSDAKRYLEHSALYRARTPFLTRPDWGTPVVEAGKLGAFEGEKEVYIGQQTGGVPDYLAAPAGQEGFLVVREPSAGETSGWDQGGYLEYRDRHADLDRLAARYEEEQKLKESRFWYHGEYFDAARLRRLFGDAMDPGNNPINFNQLFTPGPDGRPVLRDPALICYYLFYPGQEESLAGCVAPDGTIYESAEDFASFAGAWSCISILLDRPSPGAAHAPKWVGMSTRNTGVINVGGREIRVGMRLLPWSAMQTFEGAHPRFYVAQGNHTLYLPGETPPPVVPLTSADPGAAFCGSATRIVSSGSSLPGNPFAGPILVGKVVAGAAAGGGIFGPIGAGLGAAAGAIWGIAELTNTSDETITYVQPPSSPTVDTTSPAGLVIHPVGKRPAEVDASRAVTWANLDNVEVEDRKYPWLVDRETQVLWGEDPVRPGYTGRWGPRVVEDTETRRAGMKFPKFWEVFFDALVRNDPPSRVIVLTRDSGAMWTVPADWNNAKNSIECIGGGGGGLAGGVGGTGPGGSGGGGAYSKVERIALTPGANIPIAIGRGGTPGAVGASSGDGGDTLFNGTSLSASAVSARGGGGANATNGGAGGAVDGAVGTTNSPGGSGAGGSAGGAGGAGGGGAAGPLGGGASGASSTGGQFGGGGGGGNGGGTAGATGVAGDRGNNGGNGAGGSGGGLGGAAGAAGGMGISGGGGGGGGGRGSDGACGPGGQGGAGSEFDASHGSGAGGGGGGGSTTATASTGGNGGAGGLYGGGGGGGGFVAAGTAGQGGNGADGVIVIRYTP
jgi:hypothetical protein